MKFQDPKVPEVTVALIGLPGVGYITRPFPSTHSIAPSLKRAALWIGFATRKKPNTW